MAQLTRTIGIDARMYGLEHAGIGRYVENTVDRLLAKPKHHYSIITHPKHAKHFAKFDCTVVETTIRHYSLAEQTKLVRLLNNLNLDLLHVPHFNIPMLYRRPFVVTIHDILWHHVKGGSVTTLSPLVYWAKYQGYLATVKHAINRSEAIIVPSNHVKKQILHTYKTVPSEKIRVIYEGHTPIDDLEKPTISLPQSYLLYVGSLYPHKNVPTLLSALTHINRKATKPLHLVIVGSRNVFTKQISTKVKELHLESVVHFAGYQTDAALQTLYKNALCLVHPSTSEGFGLTGLEAMAAGCPVIAAKATALPEVYGKAALFFEPFNTHELVDHITTLINQPKTRQQFIDQGLQQVKQYSWDQAVKETEAIYAQTLDS
jgi:glycosyltransferase involved in cell wall biosynthesis